MAASEIELSIPLLLNNEPSLTVFGYTFGYTVFVTEPTTPHKSHASTAIFFHPLLINLMNSPYSTCIYEKIESNQEELILYHHCCVKRLKEILDYALVLFVPSLFTKSMKPVSLFKVAERMHLSSFRGVLVSFIMFQSLVIALKRIL